VEWLGAIPAHWEARQVRHVLRRIEQGWSPACSNAQADEGEWGVLKVGAVNYGRFASAENKALPAELTPLPELEVKPGDVLMSRANTLELVGSCVHVESTPARLLLCDKIFRLHLRPARVTPAFFALALQSRPARSQIELEASGASDSMQNVGQDTVRRLLLAWPPTGEQELIAVEVKGATTRLESLCSRLTSSVRVLREYRQALITAAVTGQLDIGQEAARDPEAVVRQVMEATP
jgi:type I restriction enzyme, S subunit